jgi:hypothetical protein
MAIGINGLRDEIYVSARRNKTNKNNFAKMKNKYGEGAGRTAGHLWAVLDRVQTTI